MARAYIVLARNDLGDNFLQALDLVPNTSLRNFPYDVAGQTGYLSSYLLDGVNGPVATTGAGPILVDGDTYGLSAYLIDHVEGIGVIGALPALTAAEAVAASAAVEALVPAGGALTLAAIDAAVAGALTVTDTMQAALTLAVADNQADDYYNTWSIEITGGTGIGQTRTILDYANATDIFTTTVVFNPVTDGTSVYVLTPPIGLTAGNSSGTVEEVLRILSGERYKMDDTSVVEDGGNLFSIPRIGYFVTSPNVEGPESVYTDLGGGPLPVHGKNSFVGKVLPTTAAVQTGTEDTAFVNLRSIIDTADLHLSATLGALSTLKSSTFSFLNPNFTYGASGTAAALDTTAIGTDGQAAAVTVYAADGTVI